METCICKCTINNGKCDKQHKCPVCFGYLHLICGHDYYDDSGDVVENLAFPKICNNCFEKEGNNVKGNKKKQSISESKKGGNDDEDSSGSDDNTNDIENNKVDSEESDDDEEDDTEEFFTEDEVDSFSPGFFILKDLKRGETTMNRYNELPTGVTSRTHVINKMINIPALYWGDMGGIKTQWWMTKDHSNAIKKLSVDEMKNAMLYGKVLQKGKSNCYEVALMIYESNDEVSMIHAKHIRKFLYVHKNGKSDNSSKDDRRSQKNGRGFAGGRRAAVPANRPNDNKRFNEDELIEEDEFESEDDLQIEDGEEEEDSSDDDVEEVVDKDFVRIEPRLKVERKWNVIDDKVASNYTRPTTESFVNCVSIGGWANMTPAKVFNMQLPRNEFRLWSQLTSKNLIKKNKLAVEEKEMRMFIGCLFACTQSRKVGGITKTFESNSDGLFAAQDLGRFGMKLRRFQDIMSCWEFADENAEGVDKDDLYWKTEQLFDRFNSRYACIVTHGTYVNVDERIFWSYARSQPEGIKICGRKPRGTGQEAKTMSCVDMSVTTTFEHVRGNSTNPYIRELMDEYGKAASVVIRLCKKAGIEGTNRIIIADSWFANLSLYRGLRKHGLHLIGMIKQGDGGFPKNGLCKLLDKDDLPRGSHVTAEATIDNEKVIAVAWKGKSDRGKKAKKKRKFWMSTFIASDCTTTLPGTEAEKKRHTPDGRRAPSVFVKRPKLVADYYNGMPGTDIVNRNAQFLIGLEEAIRTNDIYKRMCCTVLGTWMANAYGMAMRHFSEDKKRNMSTASFVKDVILEGLFEQKQPVQLINVGQSDDSQSLISVSTMNASINGSVVPPQNRFAIGVGAVTPSTQLIDQLAIDPYVHTMQRCADELSGVNRQQRCVMCIDEGRRTMTAYYCSLCTVTANREQDRRASKHAYCIKSEYNCYARHVAKCYVVMNRTGMVAQRDAIRQITKETRQQQVELPIAGRVVSRSIPSRRKRSKRKNKRKR